MIKSRETFLNEVLWPESCGQIFALLPGISFWIKNSTGRFMLVNKDFVKICGMQSENELLEKTDYDIWPRYLAEDYTKDDRAVMNSGKSLINKIELISNRDGSLNWHSTNKVPLYNRAKTVVGVAGFTTDLKRTEESIKPLLVMEPAVNYIMNHYAENIQIKNLADLMGLSVSALERRFKKQLGETPLKYINKIRIAAVCRLLATSRESISKIAMTTGFYDSSHFTRQFIKYTGKSPSTYRKLYQEIPNVDK